MAKTFVAVDDPVHNLLRRITRQTPLWPRLSSAGSLVLEYRVRFAELPDEYHSLALFHAVEGKSLQTLSRGCRQVPDALKPWLPARVDYFDAIKLDRRCSRDLRLRVWQEGAGMLGAELLCFGTGMLRARNDNPDDPLHQELWRRYGRLQPRQEAVLARIRALPWNSLPLLQYHGKESFDSTNLIYGDAFGELEQLWERRADIEFLEIVARGLQPLRRHGLMPVALCPPLNVQAVLQFHFRAQALWKTPPANARSLLRRLEYILEHTTVDSRPATVYRATEPLARS